MSSSNLRLQSTLSAPVQRRSLLAHAQYAPPRTSSLLQRTASATQTSTDPKQTANPPPNSPRTMDLLTAAKYQHLANTASVVPDRTRIGDSSRPPKTTSFSASAAWETSSSVSPRELRRSSSDAVELSLQQYRRGGTPSVRGESCVHMRSTRHGGACELGGGTPARASAQHRREDHNNTCSALGVKDAAELVSGRSPRSYENGSTFYPASGPANMPPSQLSTAAKDENGELAKRIAQLERETERQDSRISGQALKFNNALVKLDNRMMCDKHTVCVIARCAPDTI